MLGDVNLSNNNQLHEIIQVKNLHAKKTREN